MKVTGETFSSNQKRKGAEETRYKKNIYTFRPNNRYRTELWRTLYKSRVQLKSKLVL